VGAKWEKRESVACNMGSPRGKQRKTKPQPALFLDLSGYRRGEDSILFQEGAREEKQDTCEEARGTPETTADEEAKMWTRGTGGKVAGVARERIQREAGCPVVGARESVGGGKKCLIG